MSELRDLEKAVHDTANTESLTRCSTSPSSEDDGTVKPGQSWAAKEIHVIPSNKFIFVIPGLMCSVFLNTLDVTIVSTAMPAIVRELGDEGYSYIGAVYLLVAAALIPLYGKLTGIIGSKPLMLFSIAIFLAGSALCGTAQTFTWLVLARALQGVGFSGTFTLAQIIIADITTLEQRALYASALSVVWALGSLMGPILGGVLTDHASWRWVFYLNLPVGFVSLALLAAFLNVTPVQKKSVKEHFADFDFLGQFLVITGISCLLLSFQFANLDSWTKPRTLSLLVIGGVSLIAAGINNAFTTRSPTFPRRLFATRTTLGILVSVFIHQLPFNGILYYMPVYFQSRGDSPTLSGLQLVSLPLCAAVIAVGTGVFVAKTKRYREVIWASWIVLTLGVGLLIMLDERSSIALQQGALVITAIGLGGLFQPPIIAMQAAMPLKDVPTATAAVGLIRVIGGTFAVSIGGVIYQSELTKRLSAISGDIPSSDILDLVNIQPSELREQVIHAYSRSVSFVWFVFTPLCFVGMLCVFLIRPYSLERTVIKAPDPSNTKKPNNDSQATTLAPSASSLSVLQKV